MIEDLLADISEIEDYKKYNRIEFYKPYDFQKKFHHALGEGDFVPVRSDKNKLHLSILRALQCANQIGKSTCGAYETAVHLTGKYPTWWEGHRFDFPVEWMASSNTNETTRDRCQKELFGDPAENGSLGTGAVPKDDIGETTRKAGVPNAFEIVLVKHYTNGIFDGWSKVYLKPYEQGPKKFMGYRLHGFWDDEEPPDEILSQQKRATLATDGIGYITYTPEEGITSVVQQLMQDRRMGEAMITATWDDAPHMTPEKRQQSLLKFPEHEREMRSTGAPMLGSGMIYAVSQEEISVEPFQIPGHWPKLHGVDFGWEHPASLVCMVWDRDADKIYVYDAWKQSRALLEVHAQAIKSRGEWVPVAWPHDGMKHDPKSGKPMADIFRSMGVNMHHQPFSNPPSPGQKEGQGGNGVEVGIQEILSRMETGRFKVFSNLKEWFDEWRMYHRKNGEIVKMNDDLMDATRYAVMMRRHATTKPVRSKQKQQFSGLSNW